MLSSSSETSHHHHQKMLLVDFKMMVRVMPVGNHLPIANRFSSSTGSDASGAAVASDAFVDARSVSGITMENVIPEVCKSLRCENAFSPQDAQMRKEIATTVLITMGKDILHFEKDIDPATGIVDVNWMFVPKPDNSVEVQHSGNVFTGLQPMNIMKKQPKSSAEDLKSQAVSSRLNIWNSEDSKRLKSHAIIRVYSSHIDPKSGSKFSYLLGCEAIDLAALMQHNIHVNSGRVNPDQEHEYDFALRTNFCNTFVVCTILPSGKNVHALQQQLDLLRTSLSSYEEEETLARQQGRTPDHTGHAFMPSVLRYSLFSGPCFIF